MIIGLTGLKGSGKDTVGAYLVKEHSFQRRAFADPGKRMIADALQIPQWEIENFKNDDSVFVTTGNKNEPSPQVTEFINTEMRAGMLQAFKDFEFVPPDNIWSPIVEQTFRQFTQSFFESAKGVFGEDVWVDLTLPVGGYYKGRAIVVTDVRFKNEAQRILDIGGSIVRVENPSLSMEDPHRSETEQLEIKPHYKIVNDRSIEFLYKEVEFMLERFGDDGA